MVLSLFLEEFLDHVCEGSVAVVLDFLANDLHNVFVKIRLSVFFFFLGGLDFFFFGSFVNRFNELILINWALVNGLLGHFFDNGNRNLFFLGHCGWLF